VFLPVQSQKGDEMKPQKSNPYIEMKEFAKSQEIADHVEQIMNKFAQIYLRADYVVLRYTEVVWMCVSKKNKDGPPFFDVLLLEDTPNIVYNIPGGFQLRLHYHDSYINNMQIKELANSLHTLLKLPVLIIGKNGMEYTPESWM